MNSDLDQEITVKSHDEVFVLADQFNQIGCSLKALIDEKDKTIEDFTNLRNRICQRKLQDSIQAQEKAYNELQNTQSQLIQSEKMAGLETMVAGVCHEINNTINFVYANMPILEGYLVDLKKLIQAYEEDLSIEEITELKEEIDLEFLLEALGTMIGSCRIDSTLIIIHNRFKDMNLLTNAADAIEKREKSGSRLGRMKVLSIFQYEIVVKGFQEKSYLISLFLFSLLNRLVKVQV